MLAGGIGVIAAAGQWLHGTARVAVVVGAVAGITLLAARHTEGGRWRWRRGK